MTVIGPFDGEYRFLSNFFASSVVLDGEEYPSVEHAYQAAKTLVHSEQQQIKLAETPGKAKRLGRRVTLRSDWENVKIDVMARLVKQKFVSHSELTTKLLATGEAYLVEFNNWHDSFWGCSDGYGENHLGQILMQTRNELRS